jgi:hypothetical protein
VAQKSETLAHQRSKITQPTNGQKIGEIPGPPIKTVRIDEELHLYWRRQVYIKENKTKKRDGADEC